jgi:hypothetical protein
MVFDSNYYKEQLKINENRLKNANDKYKNSNQPNDKEMSLLYEKNVKRYSDLYIKKKQLEQKGLEQKKLEKQLDALEKDSQTKDEEQERLEKERLEEKEMLEQEKLDKIKYKQPKKLKRREERTEYHPLVTDNEDKNDNILIPQDITPQNVAPPTTLNSLPTSKIHLPIVSPPKLVKTNKKTRKKIKISNSPPVYEGIEMTDFGKGKSKMNTTRKIKKSVGFTETLKKTNAIVQQKPKPLSNSTICQNIFTDGSKINNKYFYPSEFPKLTKIKPITILTKKRRKK